MEILNFPFPAELTNQIEANIAHNCRKYIYIHNPSTIHKCICVNAEIVAPASTVPAPTHSQYISARDT